MPHTTESVEVLVIGSGVIGSSIAYHVARQGRKVLVIDHQEIAIEPAASWASAGGVRRQGQAPAEAALASAAIERWPTLADELEADLQYRQGGNLILAENDTEAEQLQEFVRLQHQLGFTDVSFMDRRAVFSLVPQLGQQVVAGSFSSSDGQANPRLTTLAFASAAQRLGAIYRTNTECLALSKTANRIVGAQTRHGNIQAEHTILAAGAWSSELASSIGLHLPLRILVLQVLLSTPAPLDVLRPVLHPFGRALSLKQLPDGEFLLGGGWFGDPTSDHRSYTLREVSQQGNWTTACEIFPPVSQQQLARSWGGLQAHIIDDVPLIGKISSLAGLTLAFGSHFGFTVAPAIGRSIANQLAGLPTPELDQLTPDRITHLDPAQISAFQTEPIAANSQG